MNVVKKRIKKAFKMLKKTKGAALIRREGKRRVNRTYRHDWRQAIQQGDDFPRKAPKLFTEREIT